MIGIIIIGIEFVLAPPEHHYYDRNYYDSNLIVLTPPKHHCYNRNYFDRNLICFKPTQAPLL